nr:DUF4158 domain-containing protein [Sphingomonas sp. Ant20]
MARTPATRLSYALQLCCLRYLDGICAGELFPAIMLDHIADQVGVDSGVIADFARRRPATISLPPSRHGLVLPI